MRENNVVLVARAVALYLLCWVGSEVTNLPARMLEVYHHLRYTEYGRTMQEHLQDVYVIGFGFAVVRVIVLFIVAGWLYRCGPRVKAFFMEPTPENAETLSGNV
jgi:hypothetical protein